MSDEVGDENSDLCDPVERLSEADEEHEVDGELEDEEHEAEEHEDEEHEADEHEADGHGADEHEEHEVDEEHEANKPKEDIKKDSPRSHIKRIHKDDLSQIRFFDLGDEEHQQDLKLATWVRWRLMIDVILF